MRYAIEAGETPRVVERRGTQLFVDGRQVDVDAVEAGHGWSLLLGHRSFEVFLDQRSAGELIVHVNGRAIAVRGGLRRFGAGSPPPDGADAQTQRPLATPMSGRVTRILVKVGDRVAAGQGLVIVEAMKMENELRAPRAGTVVEVRAVERAFVDANTVLLVIE